jgi:hypothetical protein
MSVSTAQTILAQVVPLDPVHAAAACQVILSSLIGRIALLESVQTSISSGAVVNIRLAANYGGK